MKTSLAIRACPSSSRGAYPECFFRIKSVGYTLAHPPIDCVYVGSCGGECGVSSSFWFFPNDYGVGWLLSSDARCSGNRVWSYGSPDEFFFSLCRCCRARYALSHRSVQLSLF